MLILNVLYPFFVLFSLIYFKATTRVFSFTLIAIILINLLANYQSIAEGDRLTILRTALWAAAVLTVISLIIITDNAGFAKLYPVIVNSFFLVVFFGSVVRPPTMVWRLATLKDKHLINHAQRSSIEAYCRRVTLIWCGFFVVNSLAALYTAFWASTTTWSIYNGMVSYVLMGTLFIGEYLVRRRVMKSL